MVPKSFKVYPRSSLLGLLCHPM